MRRASVYMSDEHQSDNRRKKKPHTHELTRLIDGFYLSFSTRREKKIFIYTCTSYVYIIVDILLTIRIYYNIYRYKHFLINVQPNWCQIVTVAAVEYRAVARKGSIPADGHGGVVSPITTLTFASRYWLLDTVTAVRQMKVFNFH